MWHDLRLGARALRRSAGFSTLAVLTLALGIGLTTAVSAVLNGTLWHPLPFAEAERLVAIGGAVSRSTLTEWQQAARSFDALAGYRGRAYTLSGVGTAASLKATVASGSLFTVLRANPALGRVLSAQDEGGPARVAVLGHAAWREWFHSDPAVVGRTISLNRVDFAVVGVMPPGFQFPTNVARVDIYTTIGGDVQTDRQQADTRRPRDLQVVARLKREVGLVQARAEMAAIGHRGEVGGSDVRRPVTVVPLAEQISRTLATALTVLAWAVACVLLVACATVAVLMLIRMTNRRSELATRLAVGASRRALARQFLVESLFLGLGGAVLGTAIAFVTAGPLLLAAGPNVSSVARARFDARVLGLTVFAGVVTALLVGSLPAWQAGTVRWPELLRDRGVATRPKAASRLGRLLLVAEIAVTVTLLAVCLTLVHTYTTLSDVNPGFDTDRVLTFRIDLSDALYTVPQRAQFFDRVTGEMAAVPGVQSAAFAALLPFGDLRYTMRLDRPGSAPCGAEPIGVEVHIVGPGFFRTMRVPLLGGRDFEAEDQAAGRKVAIISQELARRCFGTDDPVGRTLDAGIGPSDAEDPKLVIVGVAGNVRNGDLAVPADPQIYVPYAQAPLIASATFVARLAPSLSPSDMGGVFTAIRHRVRGLDPSVPLVAPKPLLDYVRAALVQQRFNTLITAMFAGAAILLTVVGLYAVVLYSATRRRKEYAIRRAVGAPGRTIAWLVVKEGLAAIVPGVGLGVVGAAAASRALGTMLYGVQPNEPAVLALAAVGSSVVTLIATWQPAYGATRSDLRAILQSSE
jgi:putative ABC transport system permease protein